MDAVRHEPVAVIGAGGHGKVIVSILQELRWPIVGLFDDNPAVWGRSILGVPVRGPLGELEDRDHRAVIAIGDNSRRVEVADRLLGLRWTTIPHPAAYIHRSACLGPGTVVCAGAVIQPGVVLGSHTIINTAASVDHDCFVEEFVHVAPGARLAGEVRIGRGALLGMGSVVIQQLVVGEWTTVGAGAVVVTDLPPGITAVGVPAAPVHRPCR